MDIIKSKRGRKPTGRTKPYSAFLRLSSKEEVDKVKSFVSGGFKPEVIIKPDPHLDQILHSIVLLETENEEWKKKCDGLLNDSPNITIAWLAGEVKRLQGSGKRSEYDQESS